MRFGAIILSIFFASSAFAETVIRLPRENLPVGTVLIYEGVRGIQKRRITVNNDQRIVIEVLEANDDERVSLTLVFDGQGLAKEAVYPSGLKLIYEPHNCFRVIGDCNYDFIHPNGNVYKRKYRSEFVDGVLTGQKVDESGFVLETFKMTFSSDGMLESYLYRRPTSAEGVTKLISVIDP
ncbi:hypothetical protein [Roseovarius sp. 2305UL8-3]|uniref:hypothetical protein n=1 Tax=Roseovarius conchicola TaxID=3121636 RepID=UPI003527C08A